MEKSLFILLIAETLAPACKTKQVFPVAECEDLGIERTATFILYENNVEQDASLRIR